MDNKEEIRRRATRSMVRTMKVIYVGFCLAAILVVVVIGITQIGSSGEKLRVLGEQHAYRSERIAAARGNILSDDDRILSTSIPYYELRIDFAAPGLTDELFEQNIAALAHSLSSFFKDSSASSYERKLRQARADGKRYFRIAPRKVNYVELQQIEKFPLIDRGVRQSGFIYEPSYRRVRPFGDVAVRTIGFVNSNGVKLGIEGSYDDVLRGLEGLNIKQKISGSFWIPIQSNLNIDPVNGLDVRTTINIEMQDIAQSALRDRVEEAEADWGTVVVMEVESGEIKALANITRLRDGELVEDYNYAVGMSQEPGSTFKLPVLLTLLDDGGMSMGSVIDTEDGEVMIGEAKVVDTRVGGYGRLTLEEVFEKSSNVGMAKAVNLVYGGRESHFVDRIMESGIGKELGLQIAGEPRPTIKDPRVKGSGWDGTSLTMMSYGYAVRVTPMQTLAYYNGVANGGKLVAPRLVTALLDKGKVVREFPSEVLVEQIASPGAIKEAQRALLGVVESGTARSLRNPLFTIAAKTGTAQIAMGRSGYITADGSRHYLSSIVGYFPADKPKYTMIVACKTYYKKGSDKIYYGSALAAPLFKTIAHNIYTSSYEFVTPLHGGGSGGQEGGLSGTVLPAEAGKVDSLGVPRVIGLSMNRALGMLEQRGFEVEFQGRGTVVSQSYHKDTTSGVVTISLTLE